jgi:hypothetical protein
MPESPLSSSQGLRIWPQSSIRIPIQEGQMSLQDRKNTRNFIL